ncbi:MAG: DUF3034 family protein [Gammaproteobacteria bacterium]|nr:DUF3034 family protein [Gammaproteobacteria bacterium]
MKTPIKLTCMAAMLAAGILAGTAQAAVTEIEGSGGGGIVPWALLSGDNPNSNFGAVASYTFVNTGAFTLHSIGAAATIMHRVEISAANLYLGLPGDLPGVGTNYALGTNNIQANVLGVKIKLLSMTSTLPQIAVGIQYKNNNDKALVESLGAQHSSGTDGYVAVTKVFPVGGMNLLLDGTLRETKANWMGLLGFGGPTSDSYKTEFEGSAGLFLNPQTLVGVEYRGMPNNPLANGAVQEDTSIGDAFIAYFPNKNLSFVLAAANLGQIATLTNQRALYVQVQAGF